MQKMYVNSTNQPLRPKVKQAVAVSGASPNPNAVKKDNEKLENLAIDLKNGITQNRSSGFQVDNEALIAGMNQANDYQLIKRLQMRAAKYLKIVSLNYRPYPEYQDIMVRALNNFISAMTEMIVDIYRASNPIMFDKKKYYNLVDYHVKNASQDLFKDIEPLSRTINETGYNGL